ncbi:unnamed protein product [Closterium sp. Yama58-4]|nr:unnamed protein product [Closterium sp. Yama58-4]
MLKPSPAVVDALAALEGEGEEKRGRTGEKEQWRLTGAELVNPEGENGQAGAAGAAAGAAGAAAAGAAAAAAAAVSSQAWRGLMDAQVDVMSVSRPLSSHPFLHTTFTPSDYSTEFYIIRHGEAAHNVSSLIGGRSHDAPLTALGQQQAKLLGAYLREYTGLRFDAIFSSPIERSKQTAILVCQEIGEDESRIKYSDELQELSQGTWERQPRRSIYQQGVLEQMTAAQPDFRAPGGESQRQVEFRMVEFINSVLFARQHLISPGPAALAAAHCLGLHTSHSAPSLHLLASPPPPAASSSSKEKGLMSEGGSRGWERIGVAIHAESVVVQCVRG